MSWIIVKKFSLETDLSAASGYLRERGIEHQIYENAGEQVVAVKDASVVDSLLVFLDAVAQGGIQIQATQDSQSFHKNESSLWLQIKAAYITSLLIVLCFFGALLVWLDQDYQYVRWFSFQDLSSPYFMPIINPLNSGEIWRLLTPVFLHFGIMHVLFNSLWMWDLGCRLEFLIGKRLYLLFFVSSGVISNVAQYYWSGPSLFGGMSGVVYALVGFIFVSHKLSPHKLTAVSPYIIGFMLVWLLLCMTGIIDYFIGGGVANAAHLGGLIAGALFAFLTTKRIKNSYE